MKETVSYSWRRTALSEAAVVLGYLFLAIAITWPLLPSIQSSVVGNPQSDVWDHLWTMDHTRRAVTSARVTLLDYPQAYFPEGLRLFPLNLLNELLSVPLQSLFGLAVAFNVMSLLQLVFAGWACYHMVLHFVRDRRAAWLSGMLFAFTPCTLSALVNGVPEVANSGWIPLYLWLLFRAAEDNRRWRAVLPPVAALFLSAVASWYIVAFNLMLSTFLLGWVWFVDRGSQWKPFKTRLPLIVGLGVLLVLPVALVFQSTLQHADAGDFRETHDFVERATLDPSHSATPLSFFSPLPRTNYNGFLHATFLGFGLMAFAVVGLLRGDKQNHHHGFWTTCALVFALLSLGPYLWKDGKTVFALPYRYFMEYIPFFHGLEFPYRFAVVIVLALSVVAASGMKWLFRKTGGWATAIVMTLITCLALIEFAIAADWPLPLVPTTFPAHLADLRSREGDEAVIEFPFAYNFKGRHFYNQIDHQRPVVVGINTLCPVRVQKALGLDDENVVNSLHIRRLSREQLDDLKALGIRYLIWNEWDHANHQALRGNLLQQGLKVVTKTDQFIVFDLDGTDN